MFEILIILVLVGVIITAFTLIPTLVNDAGGELQKLPSRLLTSEEHDTTDPWSPEAIALRRHAMQAAGWEPSIDPHNQRERFRYVDPQRAFEMVLTPTSYRYGIPHMFSLEIRYLDGNGAPQNFEFTVRDASPMLAKQHIVSQVDYRQYAGSGGKTAAFGRQYNAQPFADRSRDTSQPLLLKIPGTTAIAQMKFGPLSLRGGALPLFDQCFRWSTINLDAPECPATLLHVRVRGDNVTLHGELSSPKRKEWATSDDLDANRMFLLEAASKLFVELGQAYAWQGHSMLEILSNLRGEATNQDNNLRRQALEQYERLLSPDDKRAIDLERVLDENVSIDERGRLLEELIAHDPRGAEMAAVFEAAVEPDRERLRRIISKHGLRALEPKLKGPDRTRWLNLFFSDNGGATRELITTISRDITPASLLDPDLSVRAREVMLGNILHTSGDDYLGDLIGRLLEQSDEEQLIGLLRLFREVGGLNTAQAVAQLAANPEQVDKTEEYVALLSAIRAFCTRFPEVFKNKRVEAFLCSCLEHPEERVILMVPSLLEVIGGIDTLMYITNLLQQDARARLHGARLGKIVTAIRARGDLGAYAGGISLAEQQGGELTLTSDRGGLSMVDR